MKFVKMLFAVSMFVGDCMSEKVSEVSIVNCIQFMKLVNVCLFCCIL